MDFSSLFQNPKSFLRKSKVWEASADDETTFNNYRYNIQNHLRHSGIPETSLRLWIGLYRIGKRRDEAKTVVVVSCTNPRIRKLTKEGLRSCPYFQEGGALAQFKIIGKVTPPETTLEYGPSRVADDWDNEEIEEAGKSCSPHEDIPLWNPLTSLHWSRAGAYIRAAVFEPTDEYLRSFLPRDKLDGILTEEWIIQALGNEGGFPPERQKDIAQDIISPRGFDFDTQPHLHSRREILAILSLIDKVSAIESFIEDGLFDYDLPFQYVRIHDPPASDRYWVMKTCDLDRESREIPVFNQWSDADAEAFENRQWTIHVPVFAGMPKTTEKPPHYTLDRAAIVPCISRSEVGRGGFSTVSKVELHAKHISSLSDPARKAIFAIKKVDTYTQDEFHREVSALNRFSGENATHLIQLLWTFSLGATHHLVFPCAEANLLELWKSNVFGSPLAGRNDHDAALWFSRQCLGIAEGLNMIHRGSNDHNPDEPQRYGRHGDLKPENILWFSDSSTEEVGYSLGTLKISDFGMTRYHETQAKSHIVTDQIGCSRTYRAPEYDVLHEVAQSYDIWCLGCVLLEFMTWYLKGWEAVDSFSNRRAQEDRNPWIREDNFFTSIHKGNTTSAVAKNTVAMEIQSLYEHKDTSDFIIDLAQYLETSLLRMHPDHREKCADIVAKLQELFERSWRNPDYCLGIRKKPPNRRNTDLSRLDPVDLQRREIFASNPRLASSRDFHPDVRAYSLLE